MIFQSKEIWIMNEVEFKDQTLWEGHKIWKKISLCFKLLSNRVEDFFQTLWLSQNMQTFGNSQALHNTCNCLYSKVISPSVHLGCLPSKLAWSSAQFAYRAHSLQLQCGQKFYEIAKSMSVNTPVWFFNRL